jgi:dUTP pyrophosphatase
MIPTGIASAFDKNWRFLLHERGSTGIVGLKINAGLIDSGFRNEWMVLLNNTSKYDIIIDKNIDKQVIEEYGFFKRLKTGAKGLLRYPYSKAVCQAKLEEVPTVEIKETDYETLLKIESERGKGMLGSSGK